MSPLSEEMLEALFIGSEQLAELETSLNVFCPFDAIGMVRQEIRHGNFLRFMLDPRRPHGFGSDCLRALMEAAAHALRQHSVAGIRPLDVHLMHLEPAWVPGNEYKSIDILIELTRERLVVAAELKIDAAEHSGQLARYRKIVETEWPAADGWRHIFLFLTKRGDDPSDEHGAGWTALNLDDLTDALDAVVRRGSGQPEARDLLRAYIAMLRREHLSDRRLEDLARKLWAEHREALEYLSDRRPDTRGSLMSELYERRDEVAAMLSKEGQLTLLAERSTPNIVRFGVDDWDLVPGMQTGTGWKPSTRLLLFEIDKAGKDLIVCRFELGPGEAEARTAIYEAVRQGGGDVGGNWALADKWRQLAHKTLLKVTDEHAHEFDAALKQVIENAAAFLRTHATSYCGAMRSLDNSGLA